MKTKIIACRTLEQELGAAMERTQCTHEIHWVEAGLHNVPPKLRDTLQEILDSCGDCDRVLLAMSFCGNSINGLRTGDFQLVVPRCEDCISLLLGGSRERQAYPAAYFLTEGWLRGERNIWQEYLHCMDTYGQKRGKRIFDSMFSHYRHLALVDTGCFDAESCEAQVRQIAAVLGLDFIRIPGTAGYLEQLLREDLPEDRFLTVPPHSTVTLI